MKKYLLFCICSLFFSHAVAQVNYQVIPLPKDIRLTKDAPFLLDASCLIVCTNGDEQMKQNARFLQTYIQEQTGLSLTLTDKAQKITKNGPKVISLLVNPKIANAEGYRLTVHPKRGVTIEGGSPRGVFYGVQTLRKSLVTAHSAEDAAAAKTSNFIPQASSAISLPAVTINDEPRFAYRAMHLDVCRHFFSVDQVKEYIDILALHGMNTFHWHLTDDQGWRIESKKYPRLHMIGSQRRHTVIGRNSGLFDDTPHGGYYTQQQLRDVVSYAAERCITVIPEIELPGHALAILAAYPELGCTGGPYEVEPSWGVFDDILCAGNDKVFDLLCDVIDEVASIFPSPYINIGGDEAPKTRWKNCPKCQKRIREQGIRGDGKLSAEAKLQGYFTNRMEKHINTLGRSIIGWDEIMEGDISQSATVLCWRGIEHGIKAARQGHDVIMAPTAYCYFDYYQLAEDKHWQKPLLIGGYVPLEKIYSYEPVPDSLDNVTRQHIIGVQANIWTEYIAWRSLLLYQMLPRAAALSEVQWVSPGQKDFAAFRRRLSPLLSIYRQQGYIYCVTDTGE
jgi:hexosaminidase